MCGTMTNNHIYYNTRGVDPGEGTSSSSASTGWRRQGASLHRSLKQLRLSGGAVASRAALSNHGGKGASPSDTSSKAASPSSPPPSTNIPTALSEARSRAAPRTSVHSTRHSLIALVKGSWRPDSNFMEATPSWAQRTSRHRATQGLPISCVKTTTPGVARATNPPSAKEQCQT